MPKEKNKKPNWAVIFRGREGEAVLLMRERGCDDTFTATGGCKCGIVRNFEGLTDDSIWTLIPCIFHNGGKIFEINAEEVKKWKVQPIFLKEAPPF